MNDLIYNLSLLADQYAHDICDRNEHADWYQTRDQKFAELIILECADYFGREGDRRFEVDGNWIAKTIKKHFGVE